MNFGPTTSTGQSGFRQNAPTPTPTSTSKIRRWRLSIRMVSSMTDQEILKSKSKVRIWFFREQFYVIILSSVIFCIIFLRWDWLAGRQTVRLKTKRWWVWHSPDAFFPILATQLLTFLTLSYGLWTVLDMTLSGYITREESFSILGESINAN